MSHKSLFSSRPPPSALGNGSADNDAGITDAGVTEAPSCAGAPNVADTVDAVAGTNSLGVTAAAAADEEETADLAALDTILDSMAPSSMAAKATAEATRAD